MSDCCLICLGELRESEDTPPCTSSQTVPVEQDEALVLEITHSQQNIAPASEQTVDPELIACLVPCGHKLHNECLRHWLERANSCPLCRQIFNKVELKAETGGPVISSYSVEDRTQVEDFDPNSLRYDDNDRLIPPCSICGSYDDEPLLLNCEECLANCHTYCVGLDHVPDQGWFCGSCETRRAASPGSYRSPDVELLWWLRGHRENRAERQAYQRMVASRAASRRWMAAWRSVWEGVSINDRDTSLREWHRARVAAALAAGSNRLDELPVVWQESRPRPKQPEPETKEEIMAWNVFEAAKAIEEEPSGKKTQRRSINVPQSRAVRTSRKRKRNFSSSSSSLEDEIPILASSPQPERALKRPRTRRVPDQNEPYLSLARSNPHPAPDDSQAAHPSSFLRSLLKEVESSTAPTGSNGQTCLPQRGAPIDVKTAQNLSPGVSPTTSIQSSPRLISSTPPPFSPTLLTSNIEPLYPSPEFSPERSPASPGLPLHQNNSSPERALQNGRQSRFQIPSMPSSSPPRGMEGSPNRHGMSLEVKTEISAMVKDALQSPWNNQLISKQEFTEINRKVSRTLYDRIGQVEHLDSILRKAGQRMAKEEVERLLSVAHD